MPNQVDAKIRELTESFAKIARAWNSIREPPPQSLTGPAQEESETVAADSAEYGGLIEQALDVLLGPFAEWALDVVEHFGVEEFPLDATIPALPPGGCSLAELPGALMGTDDTVEAGMRLIFWGAAFKDAVFCRRARGYDGLVAQWLEDALSPSARVLTYNFGGLLGVFSDPMDWVRRAFEHLISEAAEQTVDIPQAGQASAQLHGYLMRKMDDKAILVQFGTEQGVITGVAAFRLQRLFECGRVHALELGGDTLLGKASGSIVDPSELDGLGDLEDSRDDATYGMPSRIQGSPGNLATIFQEVRRLDAAITAATSDAERTPLEEQKRSFHSYIKNFMRLGPSQVGKAKGRVERLFRSLKSHLFERMPEFAAHLDLVHYDPLTDMFVYEPADRPPWTFTGFD